MGITCSSYKSSKVDQPANRKGKPNLEGMPNASRKSSFDTTKKPGHSKRNSLTEGPGSFNNINGSKTKINPNADERGQNEGGRHFDNSIGSHTTGDTSPRKIFSYKKGPLIGKGSFGEVYECLNQNTGELLAVKSVKIYGDIMKVQNYIESLKKEVSLLKSLNHANIVKYFMADITEIKDQSCTIVDIVLEYVSGGSVRVLLDKFGKLDEGIVGCYTRQILEGLYYLHFNGIVHRDLKASNILIDANGRIKLTDFGCTKRLDKLSEENPQMPNQVKGAPYWLAPEVVSKKSQGKPADIWSVGCVVIEMLTGIPPWYNLGKTNEELASMITSGSKHHSSISNNNLALPPLPRDISTNCRDFLHRCLKFRPEDRPTALELSDHPFVRNDPGTNESFETETYQTIQTMQSNLRPTNTGNILGEMHRDETKFLGIGNHNYQQQISNLSMSGINLGRIASDGRYTNEFHTASLTKFKTNEYEGQGSDYYPSPSLSSNKYNANNVIKELPEEEQTPTNNHLKPRFFGTGGDKDSKKPQRLPTRFDDMNEEEKQKELEKIKAEKRKKWEQQMQNELARINSDKLKETLQEMEETKQLEEEKKLIAQKEIEELERLKILKRKQWEQEMEQALARLDTNQLRESVVKKKSRGGEEEQEELSRRETDSPQKSEQNRSEDEQMQMELAKEEEERLERLRIEKRKKWEEEMQNELRRISTDKLRFALHELNAGNSEESKCLETNRSEKLNTEMEDLEINDAPAKSSGGDRNQKRRDDFKKKVDRRDTEEMPSME